MLIPVREVQTVDDDDDEGVSVDSADCGTLILNIGSKRGYDVCEGCL